MQLTFCCSFLEEMLPPETLYSDCCLAAQDISDTLFANRSVGFGEERRCQFIFLFSVQCSFFFFTNFWNIIFFSFLFFFKGTLLAELREYNLEQQRRAQADSHSPDAPPEDSSISARLKGKMTSRLAHDNSHRSVALFCQHR